MRYMFPYVKKADWEAEEKEFRKFKKYSEPAFGKHYRYPSKRFRNFRSFLTEETKESVVDSSETMENQNPDV